MITEHLSVNCPTQQTLIDLHPERTCGLDSFLCAPGNNELLSHLRSLAGQLVGAQGEQTNKTMTVIYGAPGQGCSHLLQGACLDVMKAGVKGYYLPMKQLSAYMPREVLGGLNPAGLLCLDDLDAIAENKSWNEALYYDFNKRSEEGGAILASASLPPAQLPFCSPDLCSRFSSGSVFYLHPLGESSQKELIQARAKSCGFELDEAQWRYIMIRARRNTGMLIDLIEQLDKTSLLEKRRLNKSFIKKLAGW
jgi:DnaA family protein